MAGKGRGETVEEKEAELKDEKKKTGPPPTYFLQSSDTLQDVFLSLKCPKCVRKALELKHKSKQVVTHTFEVVCGNCNFIKPFSTSSLSVLIFF